MRAAATCLLLALTAACGDRRSFDERFNDTEQNLQDRARTLDQQINAVPPAEANATATSDAA